MTTEGVKPTVIRPCVLLTITFASQTSLLLLVTSVSVIEVSAEEPDVRDLSQKLSDADAEVRLSAARALDALCPNCAPAIPALVGSLRDSDKRVSAVAEKALCKLGPQAVIALADRLKPPPTNDVIGVLNPQFDTSELPKDVAGLVELAKKGDKRQRALSQLARMGPEAKEAVPALIEMIPTLKPGLFLSGAVEALGEIGPDAKDAVPAIVPLLAMEKDVDPKDLRKRMNARFVSRAAAYALIKIDQSREEVKDAVEIIVGELQSLGNNEEVYVRATAVLRRVHEKAIPGMAAAYRAKVEGQQ